MKLQHLPMGARFEFEGVVYVKTGPMTAASESGGQRIIPRHVSLRPVGAAGDGPSGGKALDAARVDAAFAAFFETCNALVDQEGRQKLAEARADFLAAIQ